MAIQMLLDLMMRAQGGEKLDGSEINLDPKVMNISLQAFIEYVDSENFESYDRYYQRLWPHVDDGCEAPVEANALTAAQKKEMALHFCKFFFRAYPEIDETLMEKIYTHTSKPVSLVKKLEREIERKVAFDDLKDVIHGFFEDWANAENAPSKALLLSDSNGTIAITAQMIHEETETINHFGRYFLFSSKPPIHSEKHGPFVRSFSTREEAIAFALEKLASDEEIETLIATGVNKALLPYKEYIDQMFQPLLSDSDLARELQCVLDLLKRYFCNHQTEISTKYRREMGKVETTLLKQKPYKSLESPRKQMLNRSLDLHHTLMKGKLNTSAPETPIKKDTLIREETTVKLELSLFQKLSGEISLDLREKVIEVLHDYDAFDRFIGLAVLGQFPKVCSSEKLKEEALGDLRKLVQLLQNTVMLTDDEVLDRVTEMYQLDNESALNSLEEVVAGLDAYDKPDVPSLVPTPQPSPMPSRNWGDTSFGYSSTPLYADPIDFSDGEDVSFDLGDEIEFHLNLDASEISMIHSPQITQLQAQAGGTPHAGAINELASMFPFVEEDFIAGLKDLFNEYLWDGALYLQTEAFDPDIEEACLAAIYLMNANEESLLKALEEKIQPRLDQNGRGGAFYLQIYRAEKEIQGKEWETSDRDFGKNEAFKSLPRLIIALKNLENSAT